MTKAKFLLSLVLLTSSLGLSACRAPIPLAPNGRLIVDRDDEDFWRGNCRKEEVKYEEKNGKIEYKYECKD